MAMQPLDDQSLSAATGQDGINIGVDVSKIEFKQLSIIDSDGAPNIDVVGSPNSTYDQRAALVFAQTPNSPIASPSITAKSGGTATSFNLNAAIDTDAGTGTNGAFANIALSFGNVDEFVISPLSIYAASDSTGVLSSINGSTYTRGSIFNSNATTATIKTGVKELLRLEDGLNIKFLASNRPQMNIQLGAAPQGKMIRFGGAIDSICGDGCNMMLVSDYDADNNPIGAGFDFSLKATNTTGFGLSKFYAGIEGTSGLDNGAFVFGNDGKSDDVDVKLNNIQLGGEIPEIPSLTDSAYRFNGLQNSSIGNIGFTKASVTDLKMRVSGM